MSEMTAEDYASVDRASRELHAAGWRKAFTLNEMFAAWASLVADVERGYDQMVDEYTNDMACRDWLSLAWPMLTENVRAARASELDSLDARFRAATYEDGGRAIGRFFAVENKAGWWWRRRPTKAEGVFAADLASE
ncbi:hypothetical protein [Nocardioides sp.]|uniref:hypothetical protein n=1 Tax=Nocardioides sp. TaxID=35761 RepID=UPI0035B4B597